MSDVENVGDETSDAEDTHWIEGPLQDQVEEGGILKDFDNDIESGENDGGDEWIQNGIHFREAGHALLELIFIVVGVRRTGTPLRLCRRRRSSKRGVAAGDDGKQ